jgi:hypothetical protein
MDASGRNHNAVIATRWDCGVCGAIWMRLSTAVLSRPSGARRQVVALAEASCTSATGSRVSGRAAMVSAARRRASPSQSSVDGGGGACSAA